MNKGWLNTFVLIFSLFFAGCAAKTPFVYPDLSIKQENITGFVLGFSNIEDLRTEDGKEIDKIYEGNPIEEIEKIIEKEMLNTGKFKLVTKIPKEQFFSQGNTKKGGINYLMKVSLKEMKWEVPNYESIVSTVFFVSFLTGGIGGVIYGSTNSDVYGYSAMEITFSNSVTGETYIHKEYFGQSMDTMTKFKMDTPTTKASIIGRSIKHIMEQFKADLRKIL